jgi:5'-nucleotidase / UDP-sugar diphosphatase
MKKTVSILLFLVLVLQSEAQTGKRIIILHTNDLHSRLTGYAPESEYTPLRLNDDNTTGGFARIAGIINAEKESHKGAMLVLDAGDFTMGTLFPCLETKTGFQLRLMKKMGYDAVGLGNHEFDFGPAWLAEVINRSASMGDIPSILSGNTVFSEEDPADNSFEELYLKNLISGKIILERDGIKIGIFSLLGKDAANLAPKAVPLTFANQTAVAKKIVRELQSEKCSLIICLSHSGLVRMKNGEWGGGDAELARQVKGLSLIVGGHSHTRLDQPLIINGTPIVQTGEFGKFVGRLSFLFSDGKPRLEEYNLIPVDDKIVADPDINNLIDEQIKKISADVLLPLDLSYQKPVAEASFIIEGNDTGEFLESNLGPLVADAIHFYVNRKSGSGTDISLIAAGMLFDRIIPGMQTVPDLFRVTPLGSGGDTIPGYPLSRLYFTGKELKSILEILQVAYKSEPENYCYYSGLRVDYNPTKKLLNKIKKIDIIHPDGTVSNVDFHRKNKSLYSITADSYMLGYIGIIKKLSHGIVNVAPKDSEGNRLSDMKKAIIDMDDRKDGVQEGKEWLALIEFLRSMNDTNGNGIPDIDKKYKAALKCFYPVNAK